MIQIGDMLVVDRPSAKLLKALAVVADQMHPGYDLQPNIKPRISRESCVLCSLTVRDFLRAIGIEAKVRPVFVEMAAWRNDVMVHSLGIGHPTDLRIPDCGRWTGHMVIAADGFLIDTTLYQAQRPAWPIMTGMIAAPLDHVLINGRRMLCGVTYVDADYSFQIGWFDNSTNAAWRQGPDGRDRNRRLPVVKRMTERFFLDWRERC